MARYAILEGVSARFDSEPTAKELETLRVVANHFKKELEVKTKYYYLKKGEIIQEGDECEISAKWNDPPKWVSAGHTVGQPAPDPQYPAHRVYRRRIN